MCGRFTLTTPTEALASQFEVPDPPLLSPRYNVAPSQVVAVVGLKPCGTRRGIALLRWGLVPSWATNPDRGPKPINVRAESAWYKFGDQLRGKRCLIPADGFYEWKAEDKAKRAHHFSLSDRRPFAFAGLWDLWAGNGRKLLTCALLTTRANALVRPVHDRMPVIVPPGGYADWLDLNAPVARVEALLAPYSADGMGVTEVGPAVNSPKNDGPECLGAA